MSRAAEQMLLVMRDVRALAKSEYNQQQGYSFRGIEGTVNAAGPKLREHGIIVQSTVFDLRIDSYQTTKGTVMNRAIVKVEYRFTAEDDSFVSAQAWGEASDVQDKSVPKAMSVAYRIALLQALCLPTHDADPDADPGHERAVEGPPPPPSERDQAFGYLRSVIRSKKLPEAEVPDAFVERMGVETKDATLQQIQDYTLHVQQTGSLR